MLNLKTLRKKYGHSLRDLSRLLGVKESTISLYESGKREATYSTLKKLSEIYSVSIDFLLGNYSDATSDTIQARVLDSVCIEGDQIEYCYRNEKFNYMPKDDSDYFFYLSSDLSMAPQISKDDVVVIKKQNEIESGQLAAVIYKQNPIVLRRVTLDGDVIVLQAFDSSVPPSVVENIDDLIILGRVVETIKKW